METVDNDGMRGQTLPPRERSLIGIAARERELRGRGSVLPKLWPFHGDHTFSAASC
jgi:hypothetical protein